jgi:hypothetical protein
MSAVGASVVGVHVKSSNKYLRFVAHCESCELLADWFCKAL